MIGMERSLQHYLSLVKKYEDVASQDDGKRRYVSLYGASSNLHFYGSHHLRDLSDPMFAELYSFTETANPDLIFLEGRLALRPSESPAARARALGELTRGTLKEVVSRSGEPGFIAHYGVQRGIAVESPEPDFESEIAHAFCQGFSPDGIAAYYLYRMIFQWNGSGGEAGLEQYLAHSVAQLSSVPGFEGYDWSFPHILMLSERFWGSPFRTEDREKYRAALVPSGSRSAGTGTEVNEVSACSSYFRDLSIATEIIVARSRARNILVVYGSGHLFTLEEALSEAFKAAR
jgi:hypothetical protein